MMSTSSPAKSSGPVGSLSPVARHCASSPYVVPVTFSFDSSTPSSFTGHQRSAPSILVPLSELFSLASRRSTSSSQDDRILRNPVGPPARSRRRSCMCSPTTPPGSFRCDLHKNARYHPHGNGGNQSAPSNRLNMRRSAMRNSLVRIKTVEESDLIKRALAALIQPSSHQKRRRGYFQPRPSRLSVMSKSDD